MSRSITAGHSDFLIRNWSLGVVNDDDRDERRLGLQLESELFPHRDKD